MEQETYSQETVDYLLSAKAVRERCGAVLREAKENRLRHFDYRPGQLPAVAEFVVQTIKESYPALKIPPHSRWRHLEKVAPQAMKHFDDELAKAPPEERARTKFELAISSVVLDAGAGPRWRYYHAPSADYFNRSEGLALASLEWFLHGGMSHDTVKQWQVTAEKLSSLSERSFFDAFQVTPENPLEGAGSRLVILQNLGAALRADPERFGPEARLGCFFDHVLRRSANGVLAASSLLREVLLAFSSIWPGRVSVNGRALGDVWEYPGFTSMKFAERLIPFHKLSQWLTYSLLEPLEEAGIRVSGLDELTGLAEYRNGGLLLDFGVLAPRDSLVLSTVQTVDSEPVVEWRAMTVSVLDIIARDVRTALGKNKEELPLPNILQGGTWEAGRLIAKRKRRDGSPPIRIKSDGTVF